MFGHKQDDVVVETGDPLMIKFLSSICVASIVLSSSAFALEPVATLSGVQGKVMVNHGDGFSPLIDADTLNIGDQVFIGQDAHAVVTYLDKNCSIDLSKPKTLTISKNAPCGAGDTTAAIDGVFVTPVNYIPSGANFISLPNVMVGVVGVAGAASLGYLILHRTPSKCTSSVSACP